MAAETVTPNAPPTSAFFVPTGHSDNSPQFQLRVAGAMGASPAGTVGKPHMIFCGAPFRFENPVVPPGLFLFCEQPGVETPGYFQRFRWNDNFRPGRKCFHGG
jgi:hypothetical protein